MPARVQVGERKIGDGEPCFIVAEIGINHNGDIKQALRLIDVAREAGCDAVKFQKRTVDLVYTAEELKQPRQSPFGTTFGQLKRGLEFDEKQFNIIIEHCRNQRIAWFASCWDSVSLEFINRKEPVCFKIASPLLTHTELLRQHREMGRPILLSTGMSTLDEIDQAIEILGRNDLVLLHCTSAYPCPLEDLNLRAIPMLHQRYTVPVGFSEHQIDRMPAIAAVALGACVIERHITLDRKNWGSDQAFSLEPLELAQLVRDIRALEIAMGDGHKRRFPSEMPALVKLRRSGKAPGAPAP